MAEIEILDVTDTDTFSLIPPCADSRFDHRTCDYWEDTERGSKANRPALLEVTRFERAARPGLDDNPFAPPSAAVVNPFVPPARADLPGSFIDDDLFATPLDNPFAPTVKRERPLREGVPRKLALLDRGRGIFGSYAKVLLEGERASAYCQFGPLSAYPRAIRLRDLYPQLPQAPPPAVISCISTTSEARSRGLGRRLVEDVCIDLAGRGFAAVEAYPDLTHSEDETSAARPGFWHTVGFITAVDDQRFPIMRREL